MVLRKKTGRTGKTPDFELINIIWRFSILFFGFIGDRTIIIGKGIVFLLKRAFSISSSNLESFVSKIYFPQPPRFDTKTLKSFLSAVVIYLRISFLRLKISVWKIQNLVTLFTKRFSLRSALKRKAYLPRPKIKLTFPRFRPVFTRRHSALVGFLLGSGATMLFVFVPYNLYATLRLLPNPHLLSQRFIPVTTQIFDRHGNLLYEIHGDEDRKPLPLTDIPQIVKQATLAIEDKNFYSHKGFSIPAIARATRETVLHHQVQGGSTLTQQLIKNALLTSELSLQRKLKEIVLAYWAERIYSKDQILEMYLNQVPYGGTAWGIEAAAQAYFGKNVKDLILSEATFLAGLPAAPSLYSPYGARADLARNRQHEVLRRMVEDGYINEQEAENVKAQDLNLKPQLTNIKAPHFVMYIRQLLSQRFGPRLVDQGGLRITTTLDLPLQENVETILSESIAQLAPLKVGNGAAIITNPATGDILAMVGSKDYFNEADDGNVNVTISPRQPGSSIKVITYAAALESGMTAATIIDDSPVSFVIPGQPNYVPVNYDGRFHGPVTLRNAFGNSYNIPAVKTLNRIGVKNMIDMGKRMGITTWNDESRFGLALTLGGGEVTLLDMATVYGVLVNQGKKVDLDGVLRVSDFTGRVFYEKGQPKAETVTSAEIAYILSDILSDNRARTAAFGPNSALVIPGKTVAVKTGTTNEKRDNLTFGYTTDRVVGVWVGNNDNTPMDPYLTSGVTGAAPIWKQIMTELLKDKPNQPFTTPANIITLPCFGRTEYFVKGTEPKGGCGTLPSPFTTPTPLRNTRR